jgi:hypothetical protein
MPNEIPNVQEQNDGANIVFTAPQTTISEETKSETSNIDFEKFKIKINLFKWLIGTIGIALITFIINWGFKDRAVGMTEIDEYNTKFATDLIVLNENPVKKRMLAQFFSTVTPSETLKDGWLSYFKQVDEEYLRFLKNKADNEMKLNDLNVKSVLNAKELEEKKVRELIKEKDDIILNAPVITPQNLNANVKSTVYIQYSNKENKSKIVDIQKTIMDNNFNAPGIEFQKNCDNSIRYFNIEDRDLADRLNTMLGNNYNVFKAIGNVPKGQIEVWIKN